MKFKVGDLVRWFELYGDVWITKDTGLGVIMEIMDVCYGDAVSTLYRVYRSEKQDSVMLEEHCVQMLEKE